MDRSLKTMSIIMVSALCLLCASVSLGDTAQPTIGEKVTVEELQQLNAYRQSISAVEELWQDGIITDQQKLQGVEHFLEEAKKIESSITLTDLATLHEGATETADAGPSIWDKIKGFNLWLVVTWIFCIVIGIVALCILVPGWFVFFLRIFSGVPKEVYEVLCYGASLGFIGWGFVSPTAVSPFLALIGCLGLGGCIALTGYLHKIESKPVKYFSLVFAIWSAVAVLLGSSMIGFIAIGALMCAVGFSAAVLPMGFFIGFKDDAVCKGTFTAFLVLTAYVLLNITGVKEVIPAQFLVFETGALFLGSFVGYLGLLILSSRWYRGGNYALMQFLTILAGASAITIGIIFGIGIFAKIGGTFFALYLIEKPFEIPELEIRGYAWMALIMSVMGSGFIYYSMTHPWIHKFLLFL